MPKRSHDRNQIYWKTSIVINNFASNCHVICQASKGTVEQSSYFFYGCNFSIGNIAWCPKLFWIQSNVLSCRHTWNKNKFPYGNLHKWSDHIQFFSAQILVFSLKQTCTINEFKALEPAEWNETGQSLPQLVLKDSKCQKMPPLKVHLENNEGKIFTHKQPHLLYLLQYFTQVSNRFNQ